jgi:nucleoside-diphosphate-sugar epimerase
MRVFVAGATGAIGRQLVPRLVAAGHEVVGMTRSPERSEQLRESGADPVVCNALDAEAVRTAINESRPQALIHELTELPARLEPRKYREGLAATNRLRREGTRNLIAAARSAGVERILAQSIAFAYAPTGDWIKGEDAPLWVEAPAPLAATMGAVADLEGQVLGAGGIALRYGYFYGPGTQFEGFFAELARSRRFPIVGRGEARWSFIHVGDAADATVAALERATPGAYNIVDDDPVQAAVWMPIYAESVGAKPPLRVPLWLGRLVGGPVAVATMMTQRGASNAKARRELDWAPAHPSWREGFGGDT